MIKGNKRKIGHIALKAFLVMYVIFTAFLGFADYIVPDEIVLSEKEIYNNKYLNVNSSQNTTVDAKLFDILPLKTVDVKVVKDTKLVPCGDVFGVKFFTKGVMVVKMTELETKDGAVNPAKKAGIKIGDVIEKIDGEEINTVEQMALVIENSRGKDLAISYRRDGKEYKCVMTPSLSLSDKKYKTGLWVRDSTAGIGTMTYYNPQTHEFAGLGHGICDVDTGLLMPLLEGGVVDVLLTDVIKGRKAAPGELKGEFDNVKIGKVTSNTNHGIYGVLSDAPAGLEEAIDVALPGEIKEGRAEIICTLPDCQKKRYQIEITKINNKDGPNKNFVIEVTDKSLIEKTGGIVQGMSGSPIIQNGKLVGAVTHVLVNDPKSGYGIFIENMLNGSD